MLSYSASHSFLQRNIRLLTIIAFAMLLLSAASLYAPCHASAGPGKVQLNGYIPNVVAISNRTGSVPPNQSIRLSFVLPLRNQSALADLLHKLYDRSDPMYGHYLTPGEFTKQFGPNESDVQAISSYAASQGLQVTDVTPNNTIVHVVGPASVVEKAFSVQLWTYTRGTGKPYYAPSSNPTLPSNIASRLVGVLGLDNSQTYHPMLVPRSPLAALGTSPKEIGNGPMGSGLTPANIKAAYNLTGVSVNGQGTTPLDGTGQTLGLFELDGYTASDITGYETQYGLPNVPLQNISVDGGVATPGGNADEVTLDIELQMALAPKVNKIVVYEAPNSGTSFPDLFAKIATDDLANSISVSWGDSFGEDNTPAGFFNSETQSFMQMAAQGQSIFLASGDSGAFTDPTLPTTPIVSDPANNQFATGVGGTTLSVNSGNGSYSSETTWNELSLGGGSGGGGISAIAGIPDYQVATVDASSDTELSKVHRNVPDVALDADPDSSGYSIFYTGTWQAFGGTSCAAPLWAAFTALVDQQRVANGGTEVGFINPDLYAIGQLPANYAADFHDIADNSTNGFYHAKTGYDLATGLGSFNGSNLLFDPILSLALTATISGTVSTANPSAPLSGATITEILDSDGEVIQTATSAADGTYSIAAPSNAGVTLNATAEGLTEEAPVTASGLAQGQTLGQQNFIMDADAHTFLNDGTPLGIQMISSPYTYQPGLSLASILGATSLKAAVWIPTSKTTGSYFLPPIFPLDTFHFGQGYWIAVPSAVKFYSVPFPSQQFQTPAPDPFTINLSPGWNMVGDPFNEAIPMSAITVTVGTQTPVSFATAFAGNQLSNFFTWQAGDTSYETISASTGNLEPWEGYWIFAQSPTTISLLAP